MMKRTIIILGASFLMAFACNQNVTPTPTPTPIIPTLSSDFESNPLVFPIQPHLIDEASGLCDSRSMPGNLWVEQDSGNPSEIYLITQKGKYVGSIKVPEPNRDWEDYNHWSWS